MEFAIMNTMNEKDIKIKVLEYLLKKKKHEVLVPEVTVGNKLVAKEHVRSDIFAVNGEISIYEIKSEKDTLTRLGKQLGLYSLYANRVSVVVAEKFLEKLSIAQNIGIYVVKQKSIELIREPQKIELSQERLSHYWTSQELDVFLMGCKGVSKYNKSKKLEYLRSLLTQEQFYYATLYMLKVRYEDESEYIKEYKGFPIRGMKPNQNLIPLMRLSFSTLMP